MITKPAAFRVYGEPAPKGSLAGRCLTHPKIGKVCTQLARIAISEDANRGRPWRKAIEQAAPLHIKERPDQYQPLAVTLLFAVTRTRAARDRAYPSTRSAQNIGGDLDKLVRLVLDALESCGVLLDDAQVVELHPKKIYYDDPDWVTQSRFDWPTAGLYCRIEPVGYVPPELPYERLDRHEMDGGYHP